MAHQIPPLEEQEQGRRSDAVEWIVGGRQAPDSSSRPGRNDSFMHHGGRIGMMRGCIALHCIALHQSWKSMLVMVPLRSVK